MNRKRSSSSSKKHVKLIQICLALLLGIYVGINIAGFYSRIVIGSESTSSQSQSNDHVEEVQRIRKELEEWKAKAGKFHNDLSASMNQLHKLEAVTEDCPNAKNFQLHQEERPEDREMMEDEGKEKRKDSGNDLPSRSPNRHPICQELPYPTPTALSLWQQNIMKILSSSKSRTDNKYDMYDFTAQLLQILTPRLPRSVKSMPYQWESLERVLDVAWDRYRFLNLPERKRLSYQKDNNNQPPPRPVKILIMGGSLLVGTNCRKLKSELDLQWSLPNRGCTWSNRVLEFLDQFFMEGLVEVTKVAMGGTNTATGSVIWKYDLIPEEARDPDIVINGYATNDMHILTILEAQSTNVTLRDKVFDMTQDFVRRVLQPPVSSSMSSSSCQKKQGSNATQTTVTTTAIRHHPPLLFHFDDYLGNEQRKVWDTTELSQVVQVLANYYGFVSISYSDTIRDIVYGDTYESWFSADWWKTGQFEREIHPGMGMHISASWVSIFNFLNLVTTYCSLPYDEIQKTSIDRYRSGLLQLPPLRNRIGQAKGKPKPHPKGLPPVLTKDLLLEDVTTLWRQQEQEHLLQYQQQQQQGKKITTTTTTVRDGVVQSDACDDDDDDEKHRQQHNHYNVKCPFSWVSGLSLQQNDKGFIIRYFQQHAYQFGNWELSNDGDKLGFVPTMRQLHHQQQQQQGEDQDQDQQQGTKRRRIINTNINSMILQFDYQYPIQSITIFYMKSYGDKWMNSQIEANVAWYHYHDNQTTTTTTRPPRQQVPFIHEEHRLIDGFHNKNTSEMYTEAIELPNPIFKEKILPLAGEEVTIIVNITQSIQSKTFKLMGLAICQ